VRRRIENDVADDLDAFASRRDVHLGEFAVEGILVPDEQAVAHGAVGRAVTEDDASAVIEEGAAAHLAMARGLHRHAEAVPRALVYVMALEDQPLDVDVAHLAQDQAVVMARRDLDAVRGSRAAVARVHVQGLRGGVEEVGVAKLIQVEPPRGAQQHPVRVGLHHVVHPEGHPHRADETRARRAPEPLQRPAGFNDAEARPPGADEDGLLRRARRRDNDLLVVHPGRDGEHVAGFQIAHAAPDRPPGRLRRAAVGRVVAVGRYEVRSGPRGTCQRQNETDREQTVSTATCALHDRSLPFPESAAAPRPHGAT